MPAPVFSWPRLRSLPTDQQTSSKQEHDTRQSPRSESTPSNFPSTLYNDVPSLPVDAADAPAPAPAPAPDAHSASPPHPPESSPGCADAVHVMDPFQETPPETVTSDVQLSSYQDGEVHPTETETDATPPSEDRPPRSLTRMKEKDGIDDQIDVLPKLANYHMTAIVLRSDTQEQGKALEQLHVQFFDSATSLMAILEEKASSQVGTGAAALSAQVNTISSLLSTMKEVRKAFHKSQERLLDVEWRMMGAEKELYARHYGKQPSSISLDDISDSHSDLTSLPLPPSSGEDQQLSESSEQIASLTRDGAPALEGLTENPEDGLEHSFIETVASGSGPLRIGHVEPSQLPSDDRLIDKSLSFDHAAKSEIPLAVEITIGQGERPSAASGQFLQTAAPPVAVGKQRKYSGKQGPAGLSYCGSQFSEKSKHTSPAKQNPGEEITLTPKYVPSSTFATSKVSRWLAYGVPWSSFATGRRHHYRLPGGVNTLQGITLNNYESVAFGLSMPGQLGLTTDTAGQNVRMALLHNWLWEPNARFDDKSNLGSIAGQADNWTQSTQFESIFQATSEQRAKFDEAILRRIEPRAAAAAHTTKNVRSNSAISRPSSRARSLP